MMRLRFMYHSIGRLLTLFFLGYFFDAKVNRLDILKREVALLKEVKHPNIIELVDLYEDENYLHLGKGWFLRFCYSFKF